MISRTSRTVLIQLMLAAALCACGSDDGGGDNPGEVQGTPLDPDIAPITEGDWFRPAPADTWQWQLQGDLNTSHEADVYDIDLFDVSAAEIAALQAQGRKVLCYFSAGSFEDFRDDSDRFKPAELGKPIDGFEEERWLDIRSTNVHAIMLDRLDLAVQKGCDGVEPDNVDGTNNDTGFPLTERDQIAFDRFLGNAAHERGLGIALKNALDLVPALVDYFDLSVNEQCHEFDECEALAPFTEANKPIFNAEYLDRFVDDEAQRQAMCEKSLRLEIRTLILPLDLDDSFRLSCD